MAAILSSGEMARLGAWTVKHVLVDTCLILRENSTLLASGGIGPSTWPNTTSGARIPCALMDMNNPVEQMTAGEQTGVITKELMLPLGTDIRKTDRVEVSGFTYHVIDLIDPSTYTVVTRVMVKRLLAA